MRSPAPGEPPRCSSGSSSKDKITSKKKGALFRFSKRTPSCRHPKTGALLTMHLKCQLAILLGSQRIIGEVSTMVTRQVRRVSKMDAVNILGVSLSTVERMIKRGDLQIEKDDLGGRHRIWILLEEETGGESAEKSGAQSAGYSPEMTDDALDMSKKEELIALRVQVKGLQDLSDFRAEQLKESDLRFQQLMQQFDRLSLALPAPAPESKPRGKGWSWLPWRRRSEGK